MTEQMLMKRQFPALRKRVLPLLISMGLGTGVYAQSLVELYAAARDYDATFQAAKAQKEANTFKADQSLALILPKVDAEAKWNTGLITQDRGFSNNALTLIATQGLYRPADEATFLQSRKTIASASSALAAAEQDLILRLSQAYFDVLAASDSLEYVKAQKNAIQEQLASAKRNFEVGTTTITDTHEAQARFDKNLADEIIADNDLRTKTLTLTQLVGKPDVKPLSVAAKFNLDDFTPVDVNEWLSIAQTEHPSLRQLKLALEVAGLDTQKANAANLPTVDLVGQYQTTTSNGAGGNAAANSNAYTVGFSVKLPIFSGYSIQNRIKETLSLEDKARADLDTAQRNVGQATRSAFLGVSSALGLVRAYEALEISSLSALNSSKLGYQVGVRINIDVLNAQSQLYEAKAKLSKARYDVLMGSLKLRQASGILKADNLNAVNDLLK